MSVEPEHRLIKRINNLPGKSGRAFDHDYGNLKATRRQQFGVRRGSARILGDEDGYFSVSSNCCSPSVVNGPRAKTSFAWGGKDAGSGSSIVRIR